MYGEGISKTGEILDLAVEKGLVEKSGAWYSYNNQRIGQGREKMLKFFLKKIKIPPMKLKKYFGQITKNKKPNLKKMLFLMAKIQLKLKTSIY